MSDLSELLQHEIHLAALSFMGIAYILRIVWLLRFSKTQEMSLPAGKNSSAVLQSMLAVTKPWPMEAGRKNPVFYLQFIIFHFGVAVAIILTFLIPYLPELLNLKTLVTALRLVLGAAFVVGLLRLYRRMTNPVLRAISSPDDYFALVMMIIFFAAGFGVLAEDYENMGLLSAFLFFLIAAFFHVYVPFSKIIHYLYYPFTRYYLGKMMKHRNMAAVIL